MGEQSSNLDYHDSGAVPGSVDRNVFFFGGRQFFSDKFSVEHYVTLFQETDFTIWVFNSLKFCFIVAVIQLILTSLAAYAFARLRFVGRKYGLMSLLVLQVFPNSMAVAGYYILIYKFGLVDSSIALIFVLAGGSAYNIWLLKSYID